MNHLSSILILTASLSASAAAPQLDISVPGSDRQTTVTALSPHIFKVVNLRAGETVPESTATVMRPSGYADSIQPVIKISAMNESIAFAGGLSADINRTDGSVVISGENFSITDSGLRKIAHDRQYIALQCAGADESFYGAGERAHAMAYKGDTLTMYNRANYGYGAGDPRNSQMNISMPLLISSRGYAIVFDDYAAGTLIAGNPIEYITESRSPVAYYIVDGNGSVPQTIARLSALTGRQELPPIWALGYITSKYGYHDSKEMLGALDSLKNAGYPVDGIVLDLYWYGREEDMGRLDWDPDQWPDHRNTLAEARDKYGVNTVLISQPFVLRNGRGIDNYNKLRHDGLLLKDSLGQSQEVEIWVGDGGMFDVSNPDTRRWLAERYRRLTDEGVGGWWGDLGEPERHPESAVHHNGLPARLYHNQYGNDWSSIIYNLYDSIYPDRRAFNLMRGGTTGLQRYSVFPWSSDVARSWEGMQAQIPAMIHSALSGLGYMSHDVGGFAVDPQHPSDSEMYLRWLQLGVYSPVLRTHAQYMAEPYHYTEIDSLLLALVKDRYRMLPYNYTLAYENATAGMPLVRPVWFHDSVPGQLDSVADEYLWGRDILIAPVMKPGVRNRSVAFPQGTWLPLSHPDTVYSGGTQATVEAPLDHIPVFLRAGAFIPVADYPMHNTADYTPEDVTVNYYPVDGISSDGFLYYDEAPFSRHKPEELSKVIKFEGHPADRSIRIDISEVSRASDKSIRNLYFRIFRMSSEPKNVEANGQPVEFEYSPTDKELTFRLSDLFSEAGTPVKIIISK